MRLPKMTAEGSLQQLRASHVGHVEALAREGVVLQALGPFLIRQGPTGLDVPCPPGYTTCVGGANNQYYMCCNANETCQTNLNTGDPECH